jgi:cell division protease FtsH
VAADDLAKATDIARRMAMRYGMARELGTVAYEEEVSPFLGDLSGLASRPRAYAEATARAIDEAVRATLAAALTSADEVLRRRRPLLDAGVALLLEKETLGEVDLTDLLRRHPDSRYGSMALRAS